MSWRLSKAMSVKVDTVLFSLERVSQQLDWFKINVKLSTEFKSDILGTLRYDIIGREVRSDYWKFIIVSFMYEKIKRKVKLTKRPGYGLFKLLNSSSI